MSLRRTYRLSCDICSEYKEFRELDKFPKGWESNQMPRHPLLHRCPECVAEDLHYPGLYRTKGLDGKPLYKRNTNKWPDRRVWKECGK